MNHFCMRIYEFFLTSKNLCKHINCDGDRSRSQMTNEIMLQNTIFGYVQLFFI